jgi:hypothetical protein
MDLENAENGSRIKWVCEFEAKIEPFFSVELSCEDLVNVN